MADKAEYNLTQKTAPLGTDEIRLLDNAASGASKRALLSALPVSTPQQTALNAKLAKTANLSDVADAATARENLGVDATAAYPCLKVANDLSDLHSAPTARENLGLGTAATHAHSDYDAAGTAATVQSNLNTEVAARVALAASVSNVTNTSDANKPVSTAQQTALDKKMDINPAVTGVSYASTINVDWKKPVQTVSLTGNTTLASANLPSTGSAEVLLILTADSQNRSVAVPTGWNLVGCKDRPYTIPANSKAVLNLVATGATDDSVLSILGV